MGEPMSDERVPCPGADCGNTIAPRQIACEECWRRIPGVLKRSFNELPAGSPQRARVVRRMHLHLQNGQASGR